MDFVIDGKELLRSVSIKLPIMVIMGDTINWYVFVEDFLWQVLLVAHETLFWINVMMHLHESYHTTDSHALSQQTCKNPGYVKANGYYAMTNNIYHKLEFCHSPGVNALTPVEPQNCILLGLFMWLLQGFNCLQQSSMQVISNTICDPYLIFMGVYKDAVQSYSKIIGFSLRQHCDPGMPHTFSHQDIYPIHMMMMTILMGKMAHEMRGVLLVILLFMLSDKQKKWLLQRVGADMLSIHLFELIILFECWLITIFSQEMN